jgi:hypothetical protein
MSCRTGTDCTLLGSGMTGIAEKDRSVPIEIENSTTHQ